MIWVWGGVISGLLMVLVGACVDFQPGIESQVGIRLVEEGEALQVRLNIEETRLIRCETPISLRRWSLIPAAWAHDVEDDDPSSVVGPRISGSASLELASNTAWLSPYMVRPGEYCGIVLTLSPPIAGDVAFEVTDSDSRRLRELTPVQIRQSFEKQNLQEEGVLSFILSFDPKVIHDALSSMETINISTRDVLRESCGVEAQWQAR